MFPKCKKNVAFDSQVNTGPYVKNGREVARTLQIANANASNIGLDFNGIDNVGDVLRLILRGKNCRININLCRAALRHLDLLVVPAMTSLSLLA
jgi:hypothetical protein